MEIRRIVKAGQSSHTVSLPKDWLEENQLSKGDKIYIQRKNSRELLISPEQGKETPPPQKEITIISTGKEQDTIQREITSAYVNNYNTINIAGENINLLAKSIRSMINDFVALEIVEQTSKRITAKDMLNLREISVDKTIRRMDMIIRSMLSDSIESIDNKELHDSIFLRDEDINRLYFLMFRLLKGAAKHQTLAEHINITPPQAFSAWHLVTNLENIADLGKTTTKHFKKLSQEDNITGLKEIYKEIEQSYLEVMKAYYNKDKPLADSVARQRIKLFEQCGRFFSKHKEPHIAEIMETFKAMATNTSNIARVVIDEE